MRITLVSPANAPIPPASHLLTTGNARSHPRIRPPHRPKPHGQQPPESSHHRGDGSDRDCGAGWRVKGVAGEDGYEEGYMRWVYTTVKGSRKIIGGSSCVAARISLQFPMSSACILCSVDSPSSTHATPSPSTSYHPPPSLPPS